MTQQRAVTKNKTHPYRAADRVRKGRDPERAASCLRPRGVANGVANGVDVDDGEVLGGAAGFGGKVSRADAERFGAVAAPG